MLQSEILQMQPYFGFDKQMNPFVTKIIDVIWLQMSAIVTIVSNFCLPDAKGRMRFCWMLIPNNIRVVLTHFMVTSYGSETVWRLRNVMFHAIAQTVKHSGRPS